MSNLFEYVDEFRLVDVDGVLITAGTYVTTNIPEGYGEADISLERGEFHGVDYEFMDDEGGLTFDRVKVAGETYSSYDLIVAAYAADGADANLVFQHYNNSVLVYEARLVLGISTKLDYGWRTHVERVDFDGKFRSREKVPFDIMGTKDMDGNAYTAPTQKNIVLAPQPILKVQTLESQGSPEATSGDAYEYASFNLGEIINSNLDNGYISTDSNIDTTNAAEKKALFIPDKYTVYDFYFDSLEIDYRITASSGNIRLRLSVYHPDVDGSGFLDDPIYNHTVYSEAATIGSTTRLSLSDESSLNRWANIGYRVAIYLEFTGASGFEYIRVISGTTRVEAEEYAPYNVTKYVDLDDGVGSVLKGMTGSDILSTGDFLGDQKAALLTGKLIRSQPSWTANDTQPFYMSWEKTMKSLEAIFGLGYSVEDNSGNEIVVEQHSNFYQNKEVLSITENVFDLEISPAKDLLINEIQIGYKKYAKGNDTALLARTNNDFLTEHNYVLPVSMEKKKKVLMSDWITSGHLISLGLGQSFAKYAEDKWANDDDNFLVAIKDTLEYSLYNVAMTIWKFDDGGGGQDQYGIQIHAHADWIKRSNAGFVSELRAVIPTHGTVTDGMAYAYTPSDFDATRPDFTNENENYIFFFIEEDLGLSGGGTGSISPITNESDIIDITFEWDNGSSPSTGISVPWTTQESASPAFTTLSNVIDADSLFNARYNIVNMLFANSQILNSTLHFKATSEEYKLASFENSADLTTRFATGEDYSTLDPNRETITQSDDLAIIDVNNGDHLFIPEIISFETILSWENITTIKEAYKNESVSDINYGYISVLAYDGVTYQGYLRKMTYQGMSEKVRFELIRKN